MYTKLLKSIVFGSASMLFSSLLATGPNEKLNQSKQIVGQYGQAITDERVLLIRVLQSIAAMLPDQSNDGMIRDFGLLGEGMVREKDLAESIFRPIITALQPTATPDELMIISEKLLQCVGQLGEAIARNKEAMAKIFQPLMKMPRPMRGDPTELMYPDEKLLVAQCKQAILENKRAMAEFLQPPTEIFLKIMNNPTISSGKVSIEEQEQLLDELNELEL
jgi:hypothetical protein